MSKTSPTKHSDAYEHLEGLSLVEGLKRTLISDPDVANLLIEGANFPPDEMIWLDALRRNKLPRLYWTVEASQADFGICNLIPFRRDPRRSSNPHIHGFLNFGSKIIYSDYVFDGPNGYGDLATPAKALFVEGEADEYANFRDRFRKTLRVRYQDFFDILRDGRLLAETLSPVTHTTILIDRAIWSLERFFIEIRESNLHESHDPSAPPLYEGITLRLPSAVQTATSPTSETRGRPEQYDWEQIQRHFFASLHTDGWPPGHAAAVKRVERVMDYLGMQIAKSTTISARMGRDIGPLWELFPKGSKPRQAHNRFRGLTQKDVPESYDG